MTKFIIKKIAKVKLRKPLLIEGLPGIANVARIAINFLIENLSAKKYADIYSFAFPNSVLVNENSGIEVFSASLYYAKGKSRDLLFLCGDAQPVSEEASYELSEKVIDLAYSLGVREVITLGGIGLSAESVKPRVHGVIIKDNYVKILKNHGVILDGNNTVKVIVGAAGLILGLAKLRGMNGFSLLAETKGDPNHIGIRAARSIVQVLINYLHLNLSVRDLDKEIRNIEKESLENIKLEKMYKAQELKKVKPNYIG